MHRKLLAPIVALAGLAGTAALACGAPSSQPASGPVAEDVRAALASGRQGFDHADWDRLLAEGTRDGLVDYPHFRRHRAELDAYLDRIAEAELAALAPEELKALLSNAYNALTIRTILEHPGVSSIREIDGVFTGITHEVGGHRLTLDNIEHNLLRPFFRDPRIHFVLNCAALSCAPLPGWAFEGERLEEQLEERTRSFLTDPANVRVADGTLELSRYFDWYGEDFTAEGWEPRAETIPAFVARYADPEVRAFIRRHDGSPPVRFLDYDWSLNAAVPPEAEGGAGRGSARRDAGTGSAVGVPEGGEAGRGGPVRVADGGEAGPGGPPSDAGWVAELRRWVRGFGPAAPLLYGLAYVLGVVLFVPGAPLTIGAGVAFGLLGGTAIVALAATTGAATAFILARHFLRKRVERWIEGREKFAAVDRAVAREGWKVVALTRLSPAFPFNLQNYAYGITAVDFWSYLVASAVAMLPGTLLYVYIGVAGTQVAAATTGAADWGRTALQVVGLLATLAVVILITRVARRELRRLTEGEEVGGARDPSGSGASAPA